MIEIFYRLAIISLLLICFSEHSFAFRLTPIYSSLKTAGREKTKIFTVENVGKEKIAIQAKIFHREEDEYGVETNDPVVDGLFSIYPEQAVIGPGKIQRIRITWNGVEEINLEKSFRLVVEQLDVKGLKQDQKKSNGGGIKILLIYRASLYVTPDKSNGNIIMNTAKILDKNGSPSLYLDFFNKGNRHQTLDELEILVKYQDKSGKQQEVKLDKETLKPINGENILAQHRKIMSVPWQGDFPLEPTEVRFKFKSE